MPVILVDEDAQQEWEEYLEEQNIDHTTEQVRDLFEDVTRQNVEAEPHLAQLPEKAIQGLANISGEAYADQIERIMRSERIEDDQVVRQTAQTGFMQDHREAQLIAKTYMMVDLYWDEIEGETHYDKDQYQKWAANTLTNLWPPHQLQNWERAQRNLPGQEDPTYQ